MSSNPRSKRREAAQPAEMDGDRAISAAIVESADLAFVGIGLDETVISWNQGAERMFGYEGAGVLGRPARVIYLGGREDELAHIWLTVLQGEQVEPYETQRRRKDGTLLDVVVSASPIKDGRGGIMGVAVIHRDISAIKRAPLYARSLIEANPYPLVTIGPEGKITDVNEPTVQVTGVARDRLIGDDFSDYFTEPDKAREGYRQVLSRGTVTDYPLTIRSAAGKLTDVLYNAYVYRDDKGNVLGVLAAARDVTEQVKAAVALRASEARNRAFLESAAQGIVIARQDGTIVQVNVRTEELFGYPRDELLGQAIEILVPEHLRGTHAGHRREFFSDPRARPMGIGLDLLGRRKDGQLFPVEISLSYVESADGILAVAFITDVTVRTHAANELRKRSAELEAANKELDTFAYSVSHDLRAPLRAIDGFSQALLEEYLDKLDAQGVDYLKRVRAASQFMGQLIDGLLDLSRVTRAEMRRQNVDLSAIARSIAEHLGRGEPDRQVKFVIADGLLTQGDPVLLRVVLLNLMSNAWKFTSKHPTATIEFGRTAHNGTEAHFVRDDGAGFDMAYADKLFGAFQRLHGRNEFEGTGIGLTTVQRIINRHGGRVWAESAIERGAAFYFTLQSERSSP